MKVGLSFSRCMRDIFEGKVNYNEILVIIARTDFDPYDDKHWKNIWEGYLYGGYSNAEWQGLDDHEGEMRDIAKNLLDMGKLHQPRKFGAHPSRLPYYWLECIVPENEQTPAVKSAWDNFKLISGLTSGRIDRHEEF